MRCHPPTRPPIAELKTWGQHALEAAVSTLGWGEVGGNNHGDEITVLRRGRILKSWQGGSWCASAASWWIEEGWAKSEGFDSWESLPQSIKDKCHVKRTARAKELVRRIRSAGMRVDDPRPGDFVLFRYPRNFHVAIVSAVGPGNAFETIDGNRGRYNRRTGHGSKVRRYDHEFGEAAIRYFARLP